MATFTTRKAAVQSIRGLAAMEARCKELQAAWGDLDYTLQCEFGYLIDKIRHLSGEIGEAYPGRAKPERGFALPMMLAIIAILCLVVASVAAASDTIPRGPLGPHGHALPAWVRLVDRDGQVRDLTVIEVDTITLCPRTGSTDIWSLDNGTGIAVIATTFGQLQLSYAMKHYNQGAVTGNPDTTGDQLLLVEDLDIVHSDGGGEGCVRYAYGVRP